MNETTFYFFYNFSHQSKWLDNVIVFFADIFPYIVIFGAAFFLLFHHEVLFSQNPISEFKKKWREIVLVFFSGIFAWILAKFLKILIQIERPFEALPDVQAIVSETGYAMPSGHATFFFALATAIYIVHKKAGLLFVFFALLISIARVAAGVHFPVDILGGAILGCLIAYFLKKI